MDPFTKQPTSRLPPYALPPPTPRGLAGWWFRLTAPPGAHHYAQAATHQERERLRRAGLASVVAPILSLATLLLVQQASDPGTLLALLLCVGGPLLALLLFNRHGRPVAAALLMVGCMELAIEVALLTTLHSGLSAAWLPTFDLFVLPLIAVGVLLSRRALGVVAVVHMGLIVGDAFLLPHAPDLVTLIVVWHGPLVLVARPLLVQIVGGVLSFVERRSTDQAIQRADRADEVAALQYRLAWDRQRQLDERLQLNETAMQLCQVMVQIANGKPFTDVPIASGHPLWEVGQGLHVMVKQLKRAAEQEQAARQVAEQTDLLHQAMERASRGAPAIWPKAMGTAIDPLIELSRVLVSRTEHQHPAVGMTSPRNKNERKTHHDTALE